MDLPPPSPQTEIVQHYSKQDLLRMQYRKYITPLNRILGSVLEDLRKNHSTHQAHVMFSQILQVRDDLVSFLALEPAEIELVNEGKK